MEGKTIFSRRLQAAIGTVECLEVVDVGCNLKWFDGLTRLTLAPFPIFYDRSIYPAGYAWLMGLSKKAITSNALPRKFRTTLQRLSLRFSDTLLCTL